MISKFIDLIIHQLIDLKDNNMLFESHFDLLKSLQIIVQQVIQTNKQTQNWNADGIWFNRFKEYTVHNINKTENLSISNEGN